PQASIFIGRQLAEPRRIFWVVLYDHGPDTTSCGHRSQVDTPIPGFAKQSLVNEAVSHKAGNERIRKTLEAEMAALEPDLPKIKARTFVLWGDHDRVLDVSSVQVLEKGLPNCTAVIMKDCGHLPMIERPEEAAKDYLSFLKGKQ
ncbi:MAG: alpha/beta hydrolase, partial [Thermodesulfobacteriota bacterium]